MNELIEPTAEEADSIEDMATGLYRRVSEETEKLLESQLKILCVDVVDFADVPGLTRHYFPTDPHALAQYEYKGHPILGLRIAKNGMAIEFDVVDPLRLAQIKNQIHITETQKKGEVQDESEQKG